MNKEYKVAIVQTHFEKLHVSPAGCQGRMAGGGWWCPESKAHFLFLVWLQAAGFGDLHSTWRCFARNFCLPLPRRRPRSSSWASVLQSPSSIPVLSSFHLPSVPRRSTSTKGPRTGFTSALLFFSCSPPSSTRAVSGRPPLPCRPTPGAQVFVGSFAGEATSTHHQVCAPPFLPFGYLYSDLSRFDKCIMPTKLKNFVQKLLVVHVYTHVLYCSAPATAPFNSTTRGWCPGLNWMGSLLARTGVLPWLQAKIVDPVLQVIRR